MSRRILFLLLAAALCSLSPTRAQDKKKNGAEPCAVQVYFDDGSVMRMVLLQESVDIETKYGKLTVPAADIRHIDLAFRLPEETVRKIDMALKDLGHDLHARREAATKELVAVGLPAMPTLERAMKSGDPEVARRAATVFAQIKEGVPAEQLRFPTQDVIQTSEFPVKGRMLTTVLRARTAYFGEVELRIGDLRHLRWITSSNDAVLTVDAALYANPNQWMETELAVSPLSPILITVSGQVDLWPQTPGQYMTGPTGYQAGRAGHLPGMLLGKVGENGKVFAIGERYEGTPGQDGKLYLQIVPSPWGNPSSGGYAVKVASRP